MNMVIKSLTLGCLIFLLTACPTTGDTVIPGTGQEEEVAIDPDIDLESFVVNQNRFMMDMYEQLSDSDENVFFSPISLTSALGMAYMGAREETAREMAGTLYIDWDHNTYAQLNRIFIEHLNSLNKLEGIEMLMANALWGQKGYPFLEEYVQTLQNNFMAHAQEVDFAQDPGQAVNTINQWVSEKTRERITQLLTEQSVTPLTRLVLTNAVYFYGLWEYPFDPDVTRERDFFLSSGNTVQVPFMHQREDFPYLETEDFQMLQLPYQDDKLAMVIILPAEGKGIRDLEEQLSWDFIEDNLEQLAIREVRTAIPRFSMRTTYGIRPFLEKMGIDKAFLATEADLSGIDGGESRDLHISSIVHQAFVEVTEEGTEAAAATGIVVGVTSYIEPKVFQADRPFLFFIRDLENGAVLFWGRLMNPDESD